MKSHEPGSDLGGNRSFVQRIEAVLLRLVDAGLAATIFLVPLVMGGRTALGQLLLVVLACGIGVCWCLRQGISADTTWIRSPALLLVSAVLFFLALQIVPLPEAWLARLSPHVYQLLPLWAPQGGEGVAVLGHWRTLSFTPAETRDGLLVVSAFAILFVVVVQRVRQPQDVETLLRWIAQATLIMAVFGLVQYFFGNGKFFWFFEPPFANTKDYVTGSFTNRNHFAQFIALGIGPMVWWLYATWRKVPAGGVWRSEVRGQRSDRPRTSDLRPPYPRVLLAVGLAVAVFAGVLSLSRGGAAAMSLAAVVCLLILYRAQLINGKALLALAGAAVLVFACLFIYGYHSVATRLEDFSSIDQLDKFHSRRKIWQADLAATADFPAAGAGLGSHAEIYPLYLAEDDSLQNLEYVHADNGYVEIAVETGIPGLALLATVMGLCAWWCLPAFRSRVSSHIAFCFAGIVPGLVASAVHSAVDFVWYVPGCMVTPVILAASACRLRQLAGPPGNELGRRVRLPRITWMEAAVRFAWLAAAVLLLRTAVPMAQNRLAAFQAESSWYRYLHLALRTPTLDKVQDLQTLQSMEEELSAVVRNQPDHARAQAQLAAVHLRLFECESQADGMAMDARQVRDAVENSHFPSDAAMNKWLSRAFGPNRHHLDEAARHARQSLELCPLRGEAYLCLAEVCFLLPSPSGRGAGSEGNGLPSPSEKGALRTGHGAGAPDKAALVDQAVRVRPFDGSVLFTAGQEAALAGNMAKTARLWRASFHAGSMHQSHLLGAVGGRIPAQALIELLQPDQAGLFQMVLYYQKHPTSDDLPYVVEQYARACDREAQSKTAAAAAAEAWTNAGRAYHSLGRSAEAVQRLREALRCDPGRFEVRLLLGSYLLEARDFDEAVTHLKWCVQKAPRNQEAQRNLEQAVDGQLHAGRRAVLTAAVPTNSPPERPAPQTR